jgi:hypothetical protein
MASYFVAVEVPYTWIEQVKNVITGALDKRFEIYKEEILKQIIYFSPDDPDPPGHHAGQVKLKDSWSAERKGKELIFRNSAPQALNLYMGTGIYNPESLPVAPHGDNLMKFPWRYRNYNWYQMKEVKGINPRSIGEGVGYDFVEDMNKAIKQGMKYAEYKSGK